MSIVLHGADPKGLEANQSSGIPGKVLIGDYDLTVEDVMELAYYVLINTALEDDDVRLKFLAKAKVLTAKDSPTAMRNKGGWLVPTE